MNAIKYCFSLIVLLLLSCTLEAQTHAELQEMQISLGQQAYSAPVKNKAITGEEISIAGIKYKKGIGVHASSTIRLKLNNSRRFTAKIGVNDNAIDYTRSSSKSIPLTDGKRMFYDVSDTHKQFIGVEGADGKVDKGSVVFRLVHNGKEIYNSGIMRQGDAVKELDVKLGGGILELIVDDANDGVSGDHAVWVNPTIEYFEIAPVMVEGGYQGEKEALSEEVSKRLQEKIAELPEISLPLDQPEYDWLIDNKKVKAQVFRTSNNKEIVLTNGLIARVFRLIPNLATVDYINQMTGETMLRAVSNEGEVIIDGKKYSIGGLGKQPEYGYTLKKWVEELSIAPNSFIIEDYDAELWFRGSGLLSWPSFV